MRDKKVSDYIKWFNEVHLPFKRECLAETEHPIVVYNEEDIKEAFYAGRKSIAKQRSKLNEG